MRTETEIQKAIIEYLKVMGIFAWRNPNIPTRGRKYNATPGMPDIMGILPGGRTLCIEVKTPKAIKGKDRGASEHQIKFLSKAQHMGALTMIASSIDEVKEALEVSHGKV